MSKKLIFLCRYNNYCYFCADKCYFRLDLELRLHILVFAALFSALTLRAGDTPSEGRQAFPLRGLVTDASTGQPVEFASLLISESGLWAVSGADGRFVINGVTPGRGSLTVQCLGYARLTVDYELTADGMLKCGGNVGAGPVPARTVSVSEGLTLSLRQQNLKLDEVTVTANRKLDAATTGYTIDRATLDQQQILNIADVASLLPGGKTVNPSLMSDTRLSLRSGSQEGGNASFGTAVEVDGLRLDNNAQHGETTGASTRTVSSSDVESVEVVTGIPSVEYGDLSNGIVKVRTRKGKSPFIIEGSLNQHTRQIAVSKGFGLLNASFEHARSFSDAASPHTAYQRNILSLHFTHTFFAGTTPLTVSAGVTGNAGGYSDEADPDVELESYDKMHDNALRATLDAQWLANKPWLTNLQLSASFSLQDRKQETYSHTSSSSTQPYIHASGLGYNIASVSGDSIALSPTGYWYVRSYHDSKPLSWAVKLKADCNRRFGPVSNRITAGSQYTATRNNGRGTYYEDTSLAPTWREYRYDALPTMHNLAFYAEDKVSIPLAGASAPPSPRLWRAAARRLGQERQAALLPGAPPHAVVQRPAGVRLHLHRRQRELLRLSHIPLAGLLQPLSAVAGHPPVGLRRGV